MPNLKLQVSRALNVIKSNATNIPMPSLITSSATTSTVTDKLVDSTIDFVALGVQVGDTVYNTTSSTAATITNVDSATQLSLNLDIMVSSDSYILYSGTNMAGSIEPCVLYIGLGGSLDVITAGGDNIVFVNVPTGSFFPVQVIKVQDNTTAANIVALW